MLSSGGSRRSSLATLCVWPGRIRSGAISLSGCSTKRLWCARGWGRVNSGVARVSLPNAIRSKSSGRGSLRTCFGRRPNAFSRACNLASNDSGVSPARGTNPTTAFTKAGDPGGQSTGEVCQSEDRKRGPSDSSPRSIIPSRIFPWESPRFAPSATIASSPTLDFT